MLVCMFGLPSDFVEGKLNFHHIVRIRERLCVRNCVGSELIYSSQDSSEPAS